MSAVRMDSSITLTTSLKGPISSSKLAVGSEILQNVNYKTCKNTVYPLPHCIVLRRLEVTASNTSNLLESALVSEEAIALMVKELNLESLKELPELRIEFADWASGISALGSC